MISLRKIALLLAIPGALAVPGTAEATYFTTANAVAAYDFNAHKMDDRWQDWVSLIRNEANGPVPDVILGQDFENDTERVQFQNYISSSTTGFGQSYASVASNTAGTIQRVVFWRTSRFGSLSSATVDRWNGYGGTDDATCTFGADNAQAVMVRLWDSAAAKYVSAASFKTPPKGTNNACAWENMKLATAKLDRVGYSGSLHLIGTDANAPDWNGTTYTCWYRGTVQAVADGCNGEADLGWSDPMYDNCSTATSPRTCLDGHWTHKNQATGATSRIDFLFAKRGAIATANSTDRRTIDKGVCTTYSDHCSVRAVVSYTTIF